MRFVFHGAAHIPARLISCVFHGFVSDEQHLRENLPLLYDLPCVGANTHTHDGSLLFFSRADLIC